MVECNCNLLISRHLWIIGVILEDFIITDDCDKIIKACMVDAEIGAKDFGTIDLPLCEQQLKLCTIFDNALPSGNWCVVGMTR